MSTLVSRWGRESSCLVDLTLVVGTDYFLVGCYDGESAASFDADSIASIPWNYLACTAADGCLRCGDGYYSLVVVLKGKWS